MCIVVGNPELLFEDPYWRPLIHDAHEHGRLIDCPDCSNALNTTCAKGAYLGRACPALQEASKEEREQRSAQDTVDMMIQQLLASDSMLS